MDTKRIVDRAKALLLSPRTEWPVIAAENATVTEVFQPYVLALAALPAVAGFLRFSVVGLGMPFAGRWRLGLVPGLRLAISAWVLDRKSTRLNSSHRT